MHREGTGKENEGEESGSQEAEGQAGRGRQRDRGQSHWLRGAPACFLSFFCSCFSFNSCFLSNFFFWEMSWSTSTPH